MQNIKFSIDPHTSGLFPETNSPDYAVLNGFYLTLSSQHSLSWKDACRVCCTDVMTEKGKEEAGVPQVSLTDKERIVALFKQLDVNHDGRIDVQEIRKRLMQQGMDPSVAEV